ncbi:FkbM family methyltransferase [Arcicella aurantiaca]|uniref:FkbM family methyltransferase n=1 Tax=Arcicella aurantiaca TaxID=591202 RepID=A0A316EBN0_9BACT|nr:FkbM family methyltransferase [Arcicella aurantiaca]PWK26183.1 FkbM family methyltransferase [Arcicella aurantiaca]
MNIFFELFIAILKVRKLPLSFSQKFELDWVLFKLAFLKIFSKNQTNVTIQLFGLIIENYNYRLLDYLIKEVFVANEYYFQTENKAPIIVDCGANIGMATLFFKWLQPNATIYSFEPQKSTFDILERNIKRNNLQNVHYFNLALSDSNGTIDFFGEDSSNLMSSVLQERSTGKKVTVECRKLSDFVSIISEPIDLLKIDVEGAETFILKDLIDTNKLDKSVFKQIIMEYHHKIENQSSKMGEFLLPFEKQGYEYQVRADFKQLSTFQDMLLHFF